MTLPERHSARNRRTGELKEEEEEEEEEDECHETALDKVVRENRICEEDELELELDEDNGGTATDEENRPLMMKLNLCGGGSDSSKGNNGVIPYLCDPSGKVGAEPFSPQKGKSLLPEQNQAPNRTGHFNLA